MSSPTLKYLFNKFNEVKETLGVKKKPDMIYPLLFIYPFVVLFVLWYVQPMIVKTRSHNGDMVLSINKVMLWFMISMLPIFVYLLLCI